MLLCVAANSYLKIPGFVAIPVMLVLLASSAFSQNSFAQDEQQEEVQLNTTSDEGTFLVKIAWMRQNELGRENTFDITFIEPETGEELEDMQYDFTIRDKQTGDEIVRRVAQVSTEQKASFDSVGSYTISIEDIDGLGENASLPIQVSPEFPAAFPVALVLAIGAVLIATRLNGTNLFRFKP